MVTGKVSGTDEVTDGLILPAWCVAEPGHWRGMSQLSAAQAAQLENRDDVGRFKTKTHADVDDTAGVLGLDEDRIQASLGATPYRGELRGADGASTEDEFYGSEEYADFRDHIDALAQRHCVDVISAQHGVPGVFDANSEPSSAIQVSGRAEDVRAMAADLAGRYNQDSVMTVAPDDNGPDSFQQFDLGDADHEEVLAVVQKSGIPGARIRDGKLEVAELGAGESGAYNAVLGQQFGPPQEFRAHVDFVEMNPQAQRADFPGHRPAPDGSDLPAGAGSSFGSDPSAVVSGVNRMRGSDFIFVDADEDEIVIAGDRNDPAAEAIVAEAAKYDRTVRFDTDPA